MKTIPSLVISVALLFGVMFGTSSLAKADEIDTVKNGVLDIDKTTTLGKAVAGYDFFTNIKWSTDTDKQGRKFVVLDAEFNDKALEIANNFKIRFKQEVNSYGHNAVRVDGAGTGPGMFHVYLLNIDIDKSGQGAFECFKGYVEKI